MSSPGTVLPFVEQQLRWTKSVESVLVSKPSSRASHSENFDLVLVGWAGSDHSVCVVSEQEEFGLLVSDT